jgi:hypothetical protein
MVFFQTALLAGYAYAHVLTRLAKPRTAVIVHLAVMAAACLMLPLHIATGWGRPPASGEAFWLLGLFALSIGPPFFALAANGPLVQAWFVRTDHPDARDPYFLYAASNVGSFLALIAYPFLIEPFASLGAQRLGWTVGFYVLILLLAGCGWLMLRSPATSAGEAPAADEGPPPRSHTAAIWTALAAVPSGLLIAVTAHISTDVAAVPLFWVVPLALYLLTFVIAFQRRPLIPHRLVVVVQPYIVLLFFVGYIVLPTTATIGLLFVHLLVLFVCALLCHGELARRRPAPRHLTAFYLWISAGGMVGGIATGLIAPHVFDWVAEYPLLIVLALLCRPGLAWPRRGSGDLPMLVAILVALGLSYVVKNYDTGFDFRTYILVTGVLLGLTAKFWRAPLPFAAIFAFLLFSTWYFNDSPSVYRVRNFFGVLNVVDTTDGKYRVLWHGTTAQGTQQVRDDEGNPISGPPEMIAEFFEGAGIAQVFNAVHAHAGRPIDFAVVGLGTGALACQVRPGDTLTYYEINPDVVRIATDPKIFQYYSECAPETKIVLGDARQHLADAPDGSYDLIFVDAFIGAAIPIHLLTREALALYFKKLKPHGIVAMHISNLNLELASVAAGIAQANGAIARIYEGGDVESNPALHHWVPHVAAIARREEDFGALATSAFWPVRARDPGQRVWSDDYSNIVGAVIRRLREHKQLN